MKNYCFALALLVVAGCQSSSTPPAPSPIVATNKVAAKKPLRLTADVVHVGDILEEDGPTQNDVAPQYRDEYGSPQISDPSVLQYTGDDSTPVDADPQPGSPWTPHFKFKALKAGTTKVHFDFLHGGHHDPKGDRDVTVKVVA